MSAEADCIFCKVIAGELPGQIVDSDDRTVAFMDINPATPGHALVVPRAHAKDLMEISDSDLQAVTVAARRLARRMSEVLETDGINLLNSCGAAAWQTVFHFHMHVVPRYDDDPLKLPWIPSAAQPGDVARVAERIRGGG